MRFYVFKGSIITGEDAEEERIKFEAYLQHRLQLQNLHRNGDIKKNVFGQTKKTIFRLFINVLLSVIISIVSNTY